MLKVEIPGAMCDGKFDCTLGYTTAAYASITQREHAPLYLGVTLGFAFPEGTNIGIAFQSLPNGINAAAFAKAISENLPANMYWFIPAGYLGVSRRRRAWFEGLWANAGHPPVLPVQAKIG